MFEAALSVINIKYSTIKTDSSGGEGSGKSSILAALLGEMKCLVGEVRWARERNVALAAQHPVIFGMCLMALFFLTRIRD